MKNRPRERPLLLRAPDVRAVLAGRRTQHRVAVRNPGYSDRTWAEAVPHNNGDGGCGIFGTDPYLRVAYDEANDRMGRRIPCPFGRVGDRLWVKEAWQTHCDKDHLAPRDLAPTDHVQYPATYGHWVSKLRHPQAMPRWASRLTLEIASVRVERLTAISEADAVAEGAREFSQTTLDSHDAMNRWCRASVLIAEKRGEPRPKTATMLGAFACQWDATHGRGAFDAAPWVWVLTFAPVAPAEGGVARG